MTIRLNSTMSKRVVIQQQSGSCLYSVLARGVLWVDQIWGQNFGTLGPYNSGTPYPNPIDFILI